MLPNKRTKRNLLVLLTAVVGVGGVLISWSIDDRPREFFAFFLLLIAFLNSNTANPFTVLMDGTDYTTLVQKQILAEHLSA